MKIFSSTQKLMWVLGLLYSDKNTRWYRWYSVFIGIVNFSIFLPVTAYIIQNKSNVAVMAESLSIAGSAQWNGMIKGLILLWHRNQIKTLLVELQQNCDQKVRQKREITYVAMNDWINYWSRINYIVMGYGILSIAFGPILLVFYHHLMEDLQPMMYRQAFGMSLPFDSNASPYFEIIYVLCIFIIVSLGYTIAVCDCFFMGCCSQIIACQRDLQNMLRNVASDNFHYKDQVLNADPNDDVNQRLVECVKFHNQIASFVKILGRISSPIIFAQFIFSVIQMGTLFFVVQAGSNIAIDRYIANGFTSMVALSELFIYCYCGNEVTYQGVSITDAAYDSNWYRCSPKQRRFFSLIMVRGERANIFQGLKMVNCSLSSYTSALNMVGSALALLKSVV